MILTFIFSKFVYTKLSDQYKFIYEKHLKSLWTEEFLNLMDLHIVITICYRMLKLRGLREYNTRYLISNTYL